MSGHAGMQRHTTADGLLIGTFPHLAVVHGVAGRLGGVSTGPYTSLNLGPRSGDEIAAVSANRARFLAALGVADARVLAPRQVHSAQVAVHRRGEPLPPSGVHDGDALITDDPDVVLMVLAADCAAVLLHDPARQVVGAVHAGWRGTAGAIPGVAIATMAEAFGSRPAEIRAAVGPAIGRCCYEVGIEVAEAVARATASPPDALFERRSREKAYLDITAANIGQLVEAGLDPKHIQAAGICTACRTDLFYSHRREGEPTGRFGAAISLVVGPTDSALAPARSA